MSAFRRETASCLVLAIAFVQPGYSAVLATRTTTTAPTLPPSTKTTTTTTSSLSPAISCTKDTATFTHGAYGVYHQYYSGTGVVENSKNPANTNLPPQTATFSGGLEPCEAIHQCGEFALNAPNPSYSGYSYGSFDVHLLKAPMPQWECIAYFLRNHEGKYFDVPDKDVVVAYGYNMPVHD